jgi:GAF domain-containing protein
LSGEEPHLLAEEHAALRRVAALVAGEVAPEEVFAAVTEEVGRLLPVDFAIMGRHEPDDSVTCVAAWGAPAAHFPIGSRSTLEGNNLVTIVLRTGRPARVEHFEDASGPIGAVGRKRGFHSSVGTPICVEGRPWGVMAVGSTTPETPLRADTEARLASFTELVATAIANAESRAALARLAAEQAALRRVATLVGRGAAPEEVFAAVIGEIGELLPVDVASMCRYEPDDTLTFVATLGDAGEPFPAGTRQRLGGNNLGSIVYETGRPARIDRYADMASGPLGVGISAAGIRSSVGTPIMVEGRLWGLIAAGSTLNRTLPADAEERLGSFTELVATAIANAESHGRLARLAEEQAALRRVATLVARGAQQEEIFAAVTEEVGRVLLVDAAAMGRYEGEDAMTTVALWSRTGKVFAAIGGRHQLGGQNASTLVFETGRPARLDAYSEGSGSLAGDIRNTGVRSSVGTPIRVEGRLWGVIHAASTREQPLPADTEARLASFTELVATAIANTESRTGLARLAEEQAALRRVATLVAQGVSPENVFAAVAEEVGQLLPVDFTHIGRYEPDGALTVLGASGSTVEHFPVGRRWGLGGKNLATIVLETGCPGRIDGYSDAFGPLGVTGREFGIRSSAGTPIMVEGRVWGVVIVGSTTERVLPPDIEARLDSFTELVATAVANAESRTGLATLAAEQTALRRVATLVARGVPPEEVFAAAAAEVGQLLPVEFADLARYESDGSITMLAAWGTTAAVLPGGARLKLGGKNVSTVVAETCAPARIESYDDASGPIGLAVRKAGIRSVVGTPVIVEGRLWGTVAAGSSLEEPLPADTESRLASFTGLLATAIANAESGAALAASRARIVVAADDSRRQIERDLHDGAQQRLVHAVIVLKLALQALSNGSESAGELVAEALRHAEQANSELRELAHGILPAALSRGGLRAGVEALVSRVALPVTTDLSVERLPAGVEATAYFVISEALTNVVKHARAAGARVTARVESGELRLEVRDDGIGGAHPGHGTGLGGLEDRVSALDGRLIVDSPPGGGTRVRALLPVPDD